jgi:succinate dehydrogenase/fumarate reductase iron-sulfur protein
LKRQNAKISIKEKDHVEHYDVPVEREMTLLGALLHIQQQIDNKVAFRWNCRSGQCGICAVRVNGNPKLACRERLLPDSHYLVEPILERHHLQSLVCDVSRPYRQYFLKSRSSGETELERKLAFKTMILKSAAKRSRHGRRK